MPLYDYSCPHCRTEFDRLVGYNKADEVICPYCGHAYAQRRISKIAARRNSEGTNLSDSSCTTGTSNAGG